MTTDGGKAARQRAESILIYAPGLGRYQTNNAAGVADVIAATLDRRRAGRYRAEASTETAPRGLRLGKTIIGPTGQFVLEVFELDYRDRFADLDSSYAPAAPLGLVRSVGYSIWSVTLLVSAWRRKAKSGIAKWQLLFGLGGTIVLLLAAAIAVGAALAAMDLLRWVPSRFTDWLPAKNVDASAVAVGSGVGIALIWSRTRSAMLLFAEHLRQNLRYLGEDRHRDTVTQMLDEAIDALLDEGWTAPIHVLGYSFGSLVVVDALLPRAGAPARPDRVVAAVRSLTTIGCPGDAVRLYFPEHFVRRIARIGDMPWTNVFIPADVFASNFSDYSDLAAEPSVDFGGIQPTSLQYTAEKLSPLTVLRMKGFRTHSGYWDLPGHASCFGMLVDAWVP